MGKRFTVGELADMHLIYEEALGNAQAAEWLYRLMYPNRRHPNRATFVAVDRRLHETDTLQVQPEDVGARGCVRTAAFEEVLLRYEGNPSQITRVFAQIIWAPHMRVYDVLHDHVLVPYDKQNAQIALAEGLWAARIVLSVVH